MVLWPFIETKTIKETFCFPTMFFIPKVLNIFWNFLKKNWGVWIESISSDTILLQENIQNTLFSVQCEKKDQSCCVEELTYPQKAEKSLLVVSGTLCNKSARGIKHELFVKSICRHAYCATLSLLQTAQNAPSETRCQGSQQQSPLCHFKGTSSDSCIFLSFSRFTLYKITLSIF